MLHWRSHQWQDLLTSATGFLWVVVVFGKSQLHSHRVGKRDACGFQDAALVLNMYKYIYIYNIIFKCYIQYIQYTYSNTDTVCPPTLVIVAAAACKLTINVQQSKKSTFFWGVSSVSIRTSNSGPKSNTLLQEWYSQAISQYDRLTLAMVKTTPGC